MLLLLLTGIGLRQWAEYQGIDLHVPKTVLEMAPGIIGLIMIVLEGALDLLSRDKVALIRSSLAAALMLVAQAAGHWRAAALVAGGQLGKPACSMPSRWSSSAAPLPSSVAGLTGDKKQEFIVYESTFSGILGIMLFGFVEHGRFYKAGACSPSGGE
ncbi:MAG: hypothetical protein WKG07_41190 [Hymenobacter sp.]